MKKHLRLIFVSGLIFVTLVAAVSAYFLYSEHLSFYSAPQDISTLSIQQGDLVVIKDNHAPAQLILPGWGRAMDTLRRPAALVILVYLPAMAVALYEIKRLAGKRQPRSYRFDQNPSE